MFGLGLGGEKYLASNGRASAFYSLLGSAVRDFAAVKLCRPDVCFMIGCPKQSTRKDKMFEVEPTEETSGFCDCCGNQTRSVWGFVHLGEGAVASYFLDWTVGKSIEDHPANFDLIYGAWGDGTTKNDRCAISLIHFENNGVPAVSVVDANSRPIAKSELASSALSREQVVGTPLAKQVFDIFDAVIVQDNRLGRSSI